MDPRVRWGIRLAARAHQLETISSPHLRCPRTHPPSSVRGHLVSSPRSLGGSPSWLEPVSDVGLPGSPVPSADLSVGPHRGSIRWIYPLDLSWTCPLDLSVGSFPLTSGSPRSVSRTRCLLVSRRPPGLRLCLPQGGGAVVDHTHPHLPLPARRQAGPTSPSLAYPLPRAPPASGTAGVGSFGPPSYSALFKEVQGPRSPFLVGPSQASIVPFWPLRPILSRFQAARSPGRHHPQGPNPHAPQLTQMVPGRPA